MIWMIQKLIRFKRMPDSAGGGKPTIDGLHATPLILSLSLSNILDFLVILNIFLDSCAPEHFEGLSFGKGDCTARLGYAEANEVPCVPMLRPAEEPVLSALLHTHYSYARLGFSLDHTHTH